ncbi:MAG: hypothetical protein ACREVO_09830 [Steroidobacteraceae bacterium]
MTRPTESRAEAKPSLDRGSGRVVAARRPVLGIEFRRGPLPAIHEALAVDWDVGRERQEEATTELLDLVTREQAVSNDQRGVS